MTIQELITESEKQLASKLNQEAFKKAFNPIPVIVDHLSEAIKQGYELGLNYKKSRKKVISHV